MAGGDIRGTIIRAIQSRRACLPFPSNRGNAFYHSLYFAINRVGFSHVANDGCTGIVSHLGRSYRNVENSDIPPNVYQVCVLYFVRACAILRIS